MTQASISSVECVAHPPAELITRHRPSSHFLFTHSPEGCSVECGQVLRDVFLTGDYGFALPVSDEHQVGILSPHLQILLFIPSCPDVNNCPTRTILRRLFDRLGDRLVHPISVF
ncbi:hypothetical protein ACFX2I_013027 [Malus domestica]